MVAGIVVFSLVTTPSGEYLAQWGKKGLEKFGIAKCPGKAIVSLGVIRVISGGGQVKLTFR